MVTKFELPKLEGTEKQVKWAEDIRRKYLEDDYEAKMIYESLVKLIENKPEVFEDSLKKAREAKEAGQELPYSVNKSLDVVDAMTKTSAKWFIENRFDL